MMRHKLLLKSFIMMLTTWVIMGGGCENTASNDSSNKTSQPPGITGEEATTLTNETQPSAANSNETTSSSSQTSGSSGGTTSGTTVTTSGGKSETEEVFNSTTRVALSAAVIDFPQSLLATSSSTGSRSFSRREGEQVHGNVFVDIYSTIPLYISLAEELKDLIKELLVHMIDNPMLSSLSLGEEFEFGEDSGDPDAPRKIKVEKPKNELYEWKVSLTFSADATQPEMIFRFTLEKDSAKGRILWSMTEDDKELTQAGMTGISIPLKVDLAFDGTTPTKSLDIKLIQDLSNLRDYATQHWATLTQAQKDVLDLGQPDKVFVHADLKADIFTVYGTSYHPGWAVEAGLNQETLFWGGERSMYMFKAKSIEGTVQGAKLFVALPGENTTDTTHVWTNDSIGQLFTEIQLKQINSLLTMLADEVDDVDSEGIGGANKTLEEEKREALFIMKWVLGDNIGALFSENKVFTKEEYDAAKAYYVGDTEIGPFFQSVSSAFVLNQWFQSVPLITGPKDNISKKEIFEIIMFPQLKQSIQVHGYQLTRAELEAFVNSPSEDQDQASFKSMYQSIQFLVNPAFYKAGSGFVGTYDEKNNLFFRFQNHSLTLSADHSLINDLKSLDLSNVVSHIPKVVKDSEIIVE
ncbi:hypothetical protein WDW89_23085 [Deltaproteobacteria bacterium TL4]